MENVICALAKVKARPELYFLARAVVVVGYVF
jgi:hypothetical protein